MATKAVGAAKVWHLEITLSMMIPYHPSEQAIELPLALTLPFTLLAWRRFLTDGSLLERTGIWSIMQIIGSSMCGIQPVMHESYWIMPANGR